MYKYRLKFSRYAISNVATLKRNSTQNQIIWGKTVTVTALCTAEPKLFKMPWMQTNHGWSDRCFPLCQRFRKFRSPVKWKGPFRLLSTRIFETTSGCGPVWPVRPIRPKFAFHFDKPVHCIPSLHLWKESQMVTTIPRGWPGLIGKYNIFLGYSHWCLTVRSDIVEKIRD